MIKLPKLSRLKKFIFPLAVLLLTLPTVISLLRPGIFQMHDDISVMRLFQMEKCIQDGQLPCRWVPDMGLGYGYPQFNYYGPLPYYLQYIFHFVGLDFYSAVKLGFALSLLLGNIAMFYLARDLFGRWGGILTAIAYGYAPYRASDLYSRGAMGETWAFVFLPLILLFLTRFIKNQNKKQLGYFALSLAGLLVTHNVSTLIFIPMAAVWGLVFILIQPNINKLKTISSLVFGGLWAVALAAFFFLPVVFESRLAHTESLISGYFNYLAHFISLKQLFLTSFWAYGSSEIGFTDDLSFFYGPIHLLLGLCSLILSTYYLISKKQKLSLVVLTSIALFLFSSFLAQNRSSFIWHRLTFLSYLQFSWRFLVTANFFLSFIAGYLALNLRTSAAKFISIILIFLIVFFNMDYFRPNIWYDQNHLEKFSGNSWEKQMTVSIFDYLPISAKFPPGKPAPILPQAVEGRASILDFNNNSNNQSFTYKANEPVTLQLSLLDWPKWKVYLDGKQIKHKTTSDLALVTIDVPEGEHRIEARLTNSPIRTIGNLLTLMAVLYSIYTLRSKDEV